MKRILLVLLCCMLISCRKADVDESRNIQVIKYAFPGAEVYAPRTSSSYGGYTYVVKDKNILRLVYTRGITNPEVSNVYILEKR